MFVDRLLQSMEKDNYLYIFLHVHKTGGMTVYNNVRLNLKEDEYILSYRHSNKEAGATHGIEAYISALPESERDKIRFIGGHCVYYGVHTLFPGKEPRYITFIREPYNKTVSEYNFQRTLYERDPDMRQARGVTGLRGNLLEFDGKWFVRNGLNPSASFLYSRMFHKLALVMNKNKIDRINGLLDSFYFVGITGEPQDFRILYELMGIEDKVEKSNVSSKFIMDREITGNEKFMYYRNRFDALLYQHALKLNEQYKKERGIPCREIRYPDYAPHYPGLTRIPWMLFDMLIKIAHRNSCKDKGMIVWMSGMARKYLKRIPASS